MRGELNSPGLSPTRLREVTAAVEDMRRAKKCPSGELFSLQTYGGDAPGSSASGSVRGVIAIHINLYLAFAFMLYMRFPG